MPITARRKYCKIKITLWAYKIYVLKMLRSLISRPRSKDELLGCSGLLGRGLWACQIWPEHRQRKKKKVQKDTKQREMKGNFKLKLPKKSIFKPLVVFLSLSWSPLQADCFWCAWFSYPALFSCRAAVGAFFFQVRDEVYIFSLPCSTWRRTNPRQAVLRSACYTPLSNNKNILRTVISWCTRDVRLFLPRPPSIVAKIWASWPRDRNTHTDTYISRY